MGLLYQAGSPSRLASSDQLAECTFGPVDPVSSAPLFFQLRPRRRTERLDDDGFLDPGVSLNPVRKSAKVFTAYGRSQSRKKRPKERCGVSSLDSIDTPIHSRTIPPSNDPPRTMPRTICPTMYLRLGSRRSMPRCVCPPIAVNSVCFTWRGKGALGLGC